MAQRLSGPGCPTRGTSRARSLCRGTGVCRERVLRSGAPAEMEHPERFGWRAALGPGAGLADASAAVMESQFLLKNDKDLRSEC